MCVRRQILTSTIRTLSSLPFLVGCGGSESRAEVQSVPVTVELASAPSPTASGARPAILTTKKDPITARLSSAEIDAARNTLGAIIRAAQESYEREMDDPKNPTSAVPLHAVCPSTHPIPEQMPIAGHPARLSDADWKAPGSGWYCLRCCDAGPTSFQYSFVVGGPYKAPARGGPDPGPHGFEACAEAQTDSEGSTKLICRSGEVDDARTSIRVSTKLFASPE